MIDRLVYRDRQGKLQEKCYRQIYSENDKQSKRVSVIYRQIGSEKDT